MSRILKGLNEVNPHNYDSDIDYYNALNRKSRGRSEDDYVEPQDDEPVRFQQKPDARPQYSISRDENREAGYNMTLTVKAPTTQKAEWAAQSYVDSEWGAKKQIGEITPVGDGVVQVHMIDNHKHGYWTPWKGEGPISKGITFNESKEVKVSVLTEAHIYKLWESAGKKLVEAQLTADQINQLFQQVEQGATAAGGNRTMLGKGKDAASAINKAWEDLKTKVQNSGPIKNVDAMYDKAAEQLKQATGGDQGVMQYVQKYRDFAKKHPVAQSLIYSALIAAAGISGVGIGGAAALGLFKMVDKLLQGEKFSSAAYSGAKTGGMAYAAGQIGQAIKGTPQDASVEIPQAAPIGDLSAVRQQAGNEAMKAVQQAMASGTTSQGDLSNIAQSVLEKYSTLQGGPLSVQTAETLGQKIAMQAAKAAGNLEESKQLSETQVNLVIGTIVARQRKLDEGIMDTVKGAAGKAVNWAKTKGANLTTKVTADKLLQAWKKAGSPTDSSDVAKIIQNAGVSSDVIKQVYGSMKIPFVAPAAQAATPAPAAQAATPAPSAATSEPAQQLIATANDALKKLQKIDPATYSALVKELTGSKGLTPGLAEDTRVELGGATVKKLQAGDTVSYFGEKARVVELNPANNYARISANGKTMNVRLSDLKRTGQDVTEEQLDELKCWPGYTRVQGVPAGAPGSCKKKTNEEELEEKWSQKYKDSINCSNPKGFSQKAHCAGKNKNEDIQEEKCPHCGGPMFSEMIMNEKKDACYYKVKSRYKVWPSAYASGALVKCRKKGASNWGNSSKQNESTEELDEDLRKWFKEKWVRFGPDGKIRGACARGDDSEGKPKCLPQAKAHALGKKGRKYAAAKKRREDPNPERRGPAKNVATKKKSNESVTENDNFKSPAAMMKGSPEALAQAQNIVQQQADKNIVGQAKIAGTIPDQGVMEKELNELSSQTLANYKKNAGQAASKADRLAQASREIGDHETANDLTQKANKRFSGIVKATKKEFDNDAKKSSAIMKGLK